MSPSWSLLYYFAFWKLMIKLIKKANARGWPLMGSLWVILGGEFLPPELVTFGFCGFFQ